MTEIFFNIDCKSTALGYSSENEETLERSFTDKKIWRVRDVANYLGCSVGHIYNLASDEKIPKVKKGKFLYFIPNRIFEWILEGEMK